MDAEDFVNKIICYAAGDRITDSTVARQVARMNLVAELRAALEAARAEEREAFVRASAELRHCYGKGSLSQHDKGLVSRAIKILELSSQEGRTDGK